jgi:hypothetical protein
VAFTHADGCAWCVTHTSYRTNSKQADDLLDDKAGSSPLKAKAPTGRAKGGSKGRRKTAGGDDKHSTQNQLMLMDNENLQVRSYVKSV